MTNLPDKDPSNARNNIIARTLAYLDRLQYRLSDRWRENANRRSLIIIFILGALSIYSYLYLIQPPDSFPLQKIVSIPSGESSKQVSELLQEKGIVRSAIAFRIMAVIQGYDRNIHAGDYIFTEPLDVFHLARIVGIGAYGLQPLKIRIPEGATTRLMATIFSIELQDFNAQNFFTKAEPLEGYLFPDTYFFLPNANENTVIEAMRQDFDLHEASIQEQVVAFGRPLSEDVIMASILEREANNTKDRQMIASVLWNRIARKMPLQADVTLQFTLPKSDFQLTFSDLASDSPYNTYNHPGLPPGPIGSPSISSLLSAVTPNKSNYLYYLADNNGVTHFCSTFACQKANEREYLGR
jgi:UPF0755 protein